MQGIKVQNFHSACLEERNIYFGYNKPMNQRCGRHNSARSSPKTRSFSRPMSRINRGTGRGRNPLDENGNASRCAVFDNVNHGRVASLMLSITPRVTQKNL